MLALSSAKYTNNLKKSASAVHTSNSTWLCLSWCKSCTFDETKTFFLDGSLFQLYFLPLYFISCILLWKYFPDGSMSIQSRPMRVIITFGYVNFRIYSVLLTRNSNASARSTIYVRWNNCLRSIRLYGKHYHWLGVNWIGLWWAFEFAFCCYTSLFDDCSYSSSQR